MVYRHTLLLQSAAGSTPLLLKYAAWSRSEVNQCFFPGGDGGGAFSVHMLVNKFPLPQTLFARFVPVDLVCCEPREQI